MHIRTEQPTDIKKIRAINKKAFGTEAEARLVDALRDSKVEIISLVAEKEGQIIGHILFSPVSLNEETDIKIMGLAPMAVLPDQQNKGVGSQLVQEGLEVCKKAGYEAIAVLGHSEYYPRFGFSPSTEFGITPEFDVPSGVFMIKELKRGALAGREGIISYHRIFKEL